MDDLQNTVTASKSHALWQMLRRTDHALHRARERELESYGISTEVASTLFTIVRLGSRATTKAIAVQRFLERNTVSEHLTRMERQGLVERVVDPERKNRARIILTPEGHEAFSKSLVRRSNKRIMSALSAEEQRQLWLLLARLRSAALDYLGMPEADVYPPSDPDELLESVEGKAVAERGHALYQLVRLTQRIIYKARQAELAQYGISTEIASALLAISRLEGQATPKLVAEQRFLERNTASDHLTRMEKRGLVQKLRDLDSKNRVRVVLTEKGKESLSLSMIRQSTRTIMSALSDEDQNVIWRFLGVLRASAVEDLEMRNLSLYPPSDPELLATDSGTHASHMD